ncbi:hypothetical protein ACF0H5_023260 [Mactra antiquata]
MAYSKSFQAKMSEECFDFTCTTCEESYNKIVEAVRYCIECSGYCCQSCTDAHKAFPALRNHNLLDASQGSQAGNQQSTLPEFPTERCSLHKGKILDVYCQVHDDVVCSTCIATNHKSCPENSIHSVPDMIGTLYRLDDTKRINRQLRKLMTSMKSMSKSKDEKLEALKGAKHEAIEKVELFEKALKSMIGRAAEDSKSEIVTTYQELENDILQDKHNVDTVDDELQQLEGKLKRSEGNRAQRFVCSKQADKKLKEAERLKVNQDKRSNEDVPLSFTPNQSVMNYVKGLHGIGQVKGLHGIGQVKVSRKKVDMYRIKGHRDIDIRMTGDNETCHSLGCCLTKDNKLIVTDQLNKKLKRINLDTMSVEDYCKLDETPCAICCTDVKEVAVTYYSSGRIQFVSIHHKMSPTRQIKLPHACYGITSKNDKLYVTDHGSSLYVYNMTGTLLNTITSNNSGTSLFSRSSHITFNEIGDKMFVGDWNKGLFCYDGAGNYLSTSSDNDLKNVDGVCVDGYGNVFVVGSNSHNVVEYNEDGKKIGVIVQQQDGLCWPLSVCFHQELNRLFVTMASSNVVKMYELE